MAFSTMKHMKFSEYSNRPGDVHYSEQPCFDASLPTINEFFKDRDIFITGGSGFMGKVLIEKLLRSCPDINKIFLLVRPKKGKEVKERIEAIKDTRLFDTLKDSYSNVLPKMVGVEGDVTELGLGLSEADLTSMENVSVIFHAAASVRFDDPLKKAILLNVRGTREVMKLALSLKKIAAVMHVSTTYCNPDLKVIQEDMLPPYCDWQEAIKVAENIDEDILNVLTPKFINFMPNTYTFSKNLSEQCIKSYEDQLPLLIFRPSIVISTMKDPIAGWMDNFNGPVGLLVGCGIGLTRTLYCSPDNIADFTPVDVAIKAMIIAVWKRAVHPKSLKLPIYNCSTSNIRNATMLQIIQMGKALSNDVPLDKILWAPGGSIASSKITNFLKVLLYHILPAFFIDLLLRAAGQKPFVTNLQRKIYTANHALEYFILNNWDFKNRNFLELANDIKPDDIKDFYYRDFIEFDIMLYFKNCILGARRFLLHEKDEDIPKAKKHLERMKLLDVVVKILLTCVFVYFLLVKSNALQIVDTYLGRFRK